MYQLVLKQLTTMTLMVIAGFIFAKAVKVTDKDQKFLSKFLLYFVNVCLIIDSFNIDFSEAKFKSFLFVALIALIVHGIMILISFLTTHSRNSENRDYNHIDRVAMIFTNCGFVGIPLIRGIFGNSGVFYLMGYLTVFNILVWTYGLYQMSGTISLIKIIKNPVVDAVIFGLILFLMPFKLPEFIAVPISMIGDCNTALAMVLIGILFADFHFSAKYTLRLIKACLVRLIICPLVIIFVLTAVWYFKPQIMDLRTMLFVVLICSSCPSATTVPSLSCIYDKDTTYASLIVSITSLLCIFTVPTLVALAEQFIK